MADALRRDLGAEVQVMDGGRGEFTVTVDGREVAHKGEDLPAVDEILAAVRTAGPVGTGS